MGVLVCLLALGAPTEADADRIARRVLSDPAYQTELPAGVGRAPAGTPAGPFGARGRAGHGDPETTGHVLVLIAKLVWWILVAVGVATGLLWLVRDLAASPERTRRRPAAPAAGPGPAPPAEADPEGLAAAGRYGDAIHALLLRVLSELRTRTTVRPAWTSREVVARVPLETAPRGSLRALVRAVERTHFGGRSADAAEYRRRADEVDALMAQIRKDAAGG